VIEFRVAGILLDIEGTTSSISFVYDEMFPFVRRELHTYLAANWGQPELAAACELIARDAGAESLAAWPESTSAAVADEVIRLMDADVKATGLKQVQGLIWSAGFESGELQSHFFEDVPPALRAWAASGCDLRIFSSGSVSAQKLFFRHTIVGDLSALLRGYYDTTTGPKKDAASYTAIAGHFELPTGQILFLSDIVDELDAARAAGMQTALCVRPGNAAVDDERGHPQIRTFAAVSMYS
jgi:enolase-phosphatase E1